MSFNAGQKYCKMVQGEHSAILPSFMKLPFVINFFVLSIFEWPLNTGFTVLLMFILNLSSAIKTNITGHYDNLRFLEIKKPCYIL